MGIFGKLFGGRGGDDGGSNSKIDKLVKKLLNAHSQTSQRQVALTQLAEIGGPEALYGILQRYTYRTDGSIVDEDEKAQVYNIIIDAGEASLGPLERFIEQHDAVYWPLKALRDLAGLDRAVEVLIRVLDKAEGVDVRVNEQKVQLVSNLRDFEHPAIRERLEGLCSDLNEDVRIMAVDGLATYGPEAALSVMMERILDPDESARVKTIIYEQLVESGWSVAPWRGQLMEEDVLPPHYQVSTRGKLERAS